MAEPWRIPGREVPGALIAAARGAMLSLCEVVWELWKWETWRGWAACARNNRRRGKWSTILPRVCGEREGAQDDAGSYVEAV
jgi:hypothetical protein